MSKCKEGVGVFNLLGAFAEGFIEGFAEATGFTNNTPKPSQSVSLRTGGFLFREK